MAENEDGQERTEEATPRRAQEAAEKGQVVRSRELTTLAMLLGAAAGLLILGPALIEGLAAQMHLGLALDPKKILDSNQIPAVLGQAFVDLLRLLAPLLGLMLVIALLGPLALGGWTFSLGFKWDRLDPIKGVARLFSWQSLMELGKALAKFMIVASVAVGLLWVREPELLHLGKEPLLPALAHTAQALGWIFLILTLPMILIAGVDVPFQILTHLRQLRMTKQEVRDESKDNEGKPEVKGRIRRLQQEFAQRRMMEKVPTADVLITNPTHYTVALHYQPDTMSAPVVVAFGIDHMALRIRERAAPHHIPQVTSPLLARALYYNCALDKPIPTSLYAAVAQVLSYIYRLRRDDLLDGKPIAMSDVPVPPDLRTQ
ncbi:MAG: flagellar biosynthesis protein FlhB [Candidatus Competibacteraceae bacterium]|nr:flagellar biosynthesis protein FlhB [Candidatus Competibacteraceae bacterium]MBK8754197.1 flagellar biosynthesis protein FlhB [Candidatus Competibacteraceae bacterium]